MKRLIGDLLEATCLKAGRLTVELTEVRVCEIARDAEEAFVTRRRSGASTWPCTHPDGSALSAHTPAACSRRSGTPHRHALKFTEAGGQVVATAEVADGEIVFRVADSGPGIDPLHQPHLFDRFWQGRNGDRRGAGLGVAIAKGIIDAHGGRIWVESALGAGTTFSFALPRSKPAVAAPDRALRSLTRVEIAAD
jgi:K+-sensing histidine kinase KdpD